MSVAPATFYPLQYDGYKDTTTMSYRLNRAAYVAVRVFNSNGSVIRKDVLGTRYSGQHAWTWGGRKDDYTRVSPGNFRIQVTASADRTQSATKTVTVASPLVLDNASVSPSTFYPSVYDGYKDTTTMSYRLSREANVTARVYNSNGSVIRKDVLGNRYFGQHKWNWSGRNNDGARVIPGNFRIQITATADRAQTASEPVTVATGWRIATGTKYTGGYYASSTATQRSWDGFHCYADRYYYLHDTNLNCWGGAYAQANYHFDIPAAAYNVSWHVSGITGCCSEGTISKWGTRLDATNYRVSVKVTVWREYDVRSVTLTYSYKYRV